MTPATLLALALQEPHLATELRYLLLLPFHQIEQPCRVR